MKETHLAQLRNDEKPHIIRRDILYQNSVSHNDTSGAVSMKPKMPCSQHISDTSTLPPHLKPFLRRQATRHCQSHVDHPVPPPHGPNYYAELCVHEESDRGNFSMTRESYPLDIGEEDQSTSNEDATLTQRHDSLSVRWCNLSASNNPNELNALILETQRYFQQFRAQLIQEPEESLG